MKQKTKGTGVVAGTILLSAASIFVRMIGFVFRVYLSNALGAEGMGVYSLIMSLYALGVTVATSGLSLAVSKLAAEEFARGNFSNARRVLRRAAGLSLILGCAVAAAMIVFAGPIAASVLKDARTVLPLRLLAPGMPFLAVSSCYRGYFIALRRMENPALGQVLEQLFKMGFILLLLGRWLPRGIEYACAVVTLGITFGEVICFAYTAIGYLIEEKRGFPRQRADIRGVTKKILAIIVPTSLTSYVRSALRLCEDVLILAGLKTFIGEADAATGLYGIIKGMVMPLLIFPLSLLSAFVITLTPEISRLEAKGENTRLERVVSRILQITCIIGVFIVAVLMTFSYELGIIVYRNGEVGEMLRQMAFLCPFMCVEMVVVSILQGLNQQTAVMRYSLMDCGLRVAMVYFLIPVFGVNGFIWMVVASNLFTSVLNLIRLLKITKIKMRLSDWVIKPVLAAVTAGQCVKAICNLYLFQTLSLWQGLLLGVFVIALVYTAALFAVGSVSPDDFSWIRQRLKIPSKHPKTAPESGF